MKVSVFRRIFTAYKTIGTTFGSWFAPIITGLLVCVIRILVGTGRILDRIFFPKAFTKTIKNPNYRGVTTPFWNNLTKVGDSSTFEVFGTPNCGKGEPNQVIRVGHASPVCLFENIQVFGGA